MQTDTSSHAQLQSDYTPRRMSIVKKKEKKAHIHKPAICILKFKYSFEGSERCVEPAVVTST